MYTPKKFQITDENTIEAFISQNPFAILASENNKKIEVTHLPINRFNDGKLCGHVALANIHSKIDEEKEVCFVFNGEHAYISPRYYKSTFNVPTWNYSAIHIYGNVKYIEDNDKVLLLLKELTEIYEGQNGWKLPNEEKYNNLTKFIRFFEINVTSIEAKFKFSQNKSDEDIAEVIKSLEEDGQVEVARFMKNETGK